MLDDVTTEDSNVCPALEICSNHVHAEKKALALLWLRSCKQSCKHKKAAAARHFEAIKRIDIKLSKDMCEVVGALMAMRP
jgi:hypothetical protein